jgi:tRNA U55 pseudouridine synthase TruB
VEIAAADLPRLRSGSVDLSRAVSLERLAERSRAADLPWISIDEALAHLPAVEIAAADLPRLRQGQPVNGRAAAGATAGLLRLRCRGGLVALGEEREGRFWPKRVFKLD